MAPSISEILKAQNNGAENSSKVLQTCSPGAIARNPTSPAIIELHTRYGTDPNNILAQFNPTLQVQYCRDVRRVHTGTAPKIGAIAAAYGRNTAEAWLRIQLNDLSEFAGCKEKLKPGQITELAQMMIEDYPHYNLAEFMLFFQRFKRCEYGKFYGAVDPMIIMQALEEFSWERAQEFAKVEKEVHAAEKAEDDRQWQLLRERYHARIPLAHNGQPIIDFLQYRLMGFDQMSDEDLSKEIDDIKNGRKIIPKDVKEILQTIKTAFETKD